MNDFQSIQTTTGSTLSQIAPAAGMTFVALIVACVARDLVATSHSSHGWAGPDSHATTCRPGFDTKSFMASGTVWAADATTPRALTPRALTPRAIGTEAKVRTRKSSNKTSEGDSKFLDTIRYHRVQDTEIEVIRA